MIANSRLLDDNYKEKSRVYSNTYYSIHKEKLNKRKRDIVKNENEQEREKRKPCLS